MIGAQRSGTTYLNSLLDAHPDITMARPARPEPKVFMSDELCSRGLDWYRATYFAHATSEELLGDKSTSYIEDGRAPERAAAMLGSAEILVVLRDPVARAVSNWRFSTDNGLEHRPLETALRENLDTSRAWDPNATSVSPFAYLERGRFADYLGPWFAQFPDTMHVVFLEELLTDESRLPRLYEEFGVDPEFRPPALGEPVNESDSEAPRLAHQLESRLRAYFQGSDAALRDLLVRQLPWPTVS